MLAIKCARKILIKKIGLDIGEETVLRGRIKTVIIRGKVSFKVDPKYLPI